MVSVFAEEWDAECHRDDHHPDVQEDHSEEACTVGRRAREVHFNDVASASKAFSCAAKELDRSKIALYTISRIHV